MAGGGLQSAGCWTPRLVGSLLRPRACVTTCAHWAAHIEARAVRYCTASSAWVPTSSSANPTFPLPASILVSTALPQPTRQGSHPPPSCGGQPVPSNRLVSYVSLVRRRPTLSDVGLATTTAIRGYTRAMRQMTHMASTLLGHVTGAQAQRRDNLAPGAGI